MTKKVEAQPRNSITFSVAGASVTMDAKALSDMWIDRLRYGATPVPVASAVMAAPAIGAAWPEQGGTYAGIMRGAAGAPDYHLILCDTDDAGSLNWENAKKWAAGLSVGALQDFTLPERYEQALLYANLHDLFASEWYWSATQHASYSGYAWGQHFGYGYQTFNGKNSKFRARAVRRLIIQ